MSHPLILVKKVQLENFRWKENIDIKVWKRLYRKSFHSTFKEQNYYKSVCYVSVCWSVVHFNKTYNISNFNSNTPMLVFGTRDLKG